MHFIPLSCVSTQYENSKLQRTWCGAVSAQQDARNLSAEAKKSDSIPQLVFEHYVNT